MTVTRLELVVILTHGVDKSPLDVARSVEIHLDNHLRNNPFPISGVRAQLKVKKMASMDTEEDDDA